MLTPEQLAHCADDIVELYSQLDEAIIRDIARRIVKAGYLTETGIWQAQMLQDSGMLQNDILASVARYSGESDELIKILFDSAAIEAVEYDMSIYTANGLEPLPLNMSPWAMQALEAGYNKTNGNLKNLTKTTAVTSQTEFINACTMAELKIESGAFDYNTAICEAIKQVAEKGAYVLYPSGHRDRLDVAVRRNVMTGIGQTTGEICLGYAKELDCDLMEITAHAGARPSHATWQGGIVSLSGKRGYLSISDIGYGTGAGFKGWNCRHDWFPYFEGSSRMYTEKDLKALDDKDIKYPDGSMHTYYEAEQQQRAYERAIRATKRYLSACNEALGFSTDELLSERLKFDFKQNSVKLKSQEVKLKNFCKEAGLLPDNARIRSNGFNRSVSQKSVSKAESYYKDWSKGININNIKSLADYYNVKYNDVERYRLLQDYVKSVSRGMLSPMTGFDMYERYHHRIQNELIGLITSSGIEIKSHSKHFLERVFGTKADPTHGNKPRSGVTLEDIKSALTSGKVKYHYIKGKNGNRILDPEGVSFVNDKCSVSANPRTGNLIQVSPK